MELEEIVAPWVSELDTAMRPYWQFVDEVAKVTQSIVDSQTKSSDDHPFVLKNLNAEIADLKTALHEAVTEAKVKASDHAKIIAEADQALRNREAQIDEYKIALDQLRALTRSVQTETHPKPSPSESKIRSSEKIPATETGASEPKTIFPERAVLLVDDAEINRVLMSHYFKGLPVKLEFAVSVSVALQMCRQKRYDLIIIDDELEGLADPQFRATDSKLVALSNRSRALATEANSFEHVLSRGQAREAFTQQLKAFLWDAERIAANPV